MVQILVIEDDIQFSHMLEKMLQQDGHQIVTASDGAEALKLLPTIKPDLILTDILMPHLDGVETIMQLAQQGSEVPIIAMSGGRRSISAAFNLDSAKLLGVKAVLAKPFSRADLRLAIAESLA
ncbi:MULTISPECIES: response regulator [unclassified Undibacterium]|uniref:response regulator n=1 Tax=unclassified Undibacterium TaxID=2630295 RepID=UPI002AC8D389|nr:MULTISPECIES: response regulator [unclassified Undibacterium]MEB0140167.1 response regulator [Undibacterium sp. CCC2.1]MEB0172459.1 response regulator [Undibacterium sp. CCC1.1]MEB0176977.1 response regulator [Undibacterium sp. CCC3.4]MEB0215581.1 response regulator [Undibacterium sp. 5I2]WPX43712.1 response regulator [Undibacterium sp. CCC3.4]